ncbi:MAG: hypothetical protein M3O91_03515 [Chloroflexota bacterium]|nr:hypothetical protein [Chloroflexota bacterium]
MAGARAIPGVTHVHAETQHWLLTLRYDTALTEERAVTKALGEVVDRAIR